MSLTVFIWNNFYILDCNQNFTGENGQIFSPGFPGRYPTNAYCLIRITAPTGRSVSLYFNQFYIERHSTCRFDYLEVHNGTRETNTTVSKLCGNTLPDPIFISTNQILLKFVTDSSVTHTG
ncbi:hypothetical protein LOTGIDRAFT_149014 [Lottia gigantea]|uniref:CUB domain-containing protein n=1 Tax=Lottia gigantea TaxID=225164 RepID=V4B0J7_LOTGI|nr:hypothetical protein LOTGIDRAFT_149014 [Lottia gigantea]ESO99656.1 hypothetical protein LOTGIDRAFT_149014 [Lottia gigantea]